MGNECWNCARVGTCNMIRPCNNFLEYIPRVTLEQVAKLCDTSVSTVVRRLRRNHDGALIWISEKCGFEFKRDKVNERCSGFRLAKRNTENCIKLTTKLKELEVL